MLVRFNSWPELLTHVRAGRAVWYRAPLDNNACLVRAVARPMGRTVRVRSFSGGRGRVAPFDPFTADSAHLERFRHNVES
jgi:hypothetical protein